MEYDDRSQLERHLDETASAQPSDPGRRLAEALRQRNVERSRSPKQANLSIEVLDKKRTALENEYEEFVAFMATRIPTGARFLKSRASATRSRNLEKRGKILKYNRSSDEARCLLDGSRKVEWDRYKKYNAVTVIPKAKALDLIANGAEELPMQ